LAQTLAGVTHDSGRIRDIVNDRGQRVMEAVPGTPCAISGLDELPDAGDKFFVVDSLKEAEQAANERRQAERLRAFLARPPCVILDESLNSLDEAGEMAITAALLAELREKTMIVVSHRRQVASLFPNRIEFVRGGKTTLVREARGG
ncbi:MAG: hypothetical protein ACO3CC_17630, partial [Alphaproteobacteria bacterium]